MKVAAYPKYKEYAPKDWVGNSGLPFHWKVKALKHGAHIVLGKMLCPVNKGGYQLKPYLKSKNIQWLSVNFADVDEMWFSLQEMRQYKLVKGDLVLSEGGEVGKTCIWDDELEECYIQNSAHKVTMRRGNVSRFFLYQMYAFGTHGLFDAAVNRVSIAHLTYEKLSNIAFAFPPLPEQRAIAAFLDAKCVAIDEAVRIKEAQIALLRERRQILIQQAVTRGLNPDAPMKDSGINWIGQIPAHWEVRRSKFLFTQSKELARKGDSQLSATQSYGVIRQEQFEELVGRRVVKISTNLDKRKHVELNDFVISMRSFQGGLERAHATGCIRSSYVVLRPTPEVNPDFFGYLLKVPRYIHALQITGNFIRDGQDLTFENFANVDLYVPPYHEQSEIAEYIKRGREAIDNAITLKQSQITALKEFKAVLVNAAVTGKIKVA